MFMTGRYLLVHPRAQAPSTAFFGLRENMLPFAGGQPGDQAPWQGPAEATA